MAGGKASGSRKGRKVGRNFRFHGVAQKLSAYRQRQKLEIPRGGDGGLWRAHSAY